jgi:hypothetical protein
MKRVAVLAVLLGCGGATATTPVALPTASANATATTAPSVPMRGPSEALLHAWPLGSAPTIAYADLEGLAHTKLFEGLLGALFGLPSLLTAEQTTCARSLASTMKEVAFGVHGQEEALVARFAPSASLRSCVNQVFGVAQATVSDDGIVVAARRVASSGNPADLRALRLEADAYLVGHFKDTDGTAGDVSLRVSDAHVAVSVGADLQDENAAKLVEDGVKTSPDAIKALAPSAKPEELEGLARLVSALHVTRKGAHLDVLFDLREPPVAQARDLGMAAALAISGVRRYLLESKKAEALNNIGQISKNMTMDWERETLTPARPKKLRSFPPVPKTVPRGVKYVSEPDDWKAWAPLRFTIDQPQYYQYEVRAAPDGQSADIIAHGDLNGDGKASTFKLSVRVDRTKHLTVSPAPVITDGDE